MASLSATALHSAASGCVRLAAHQAPPSRALHSASFFSPLRLSLTSAQRPSSAFVRSPAAIVPRAQTGDSNSTPASDETSSPGFGLGGPGTWFGFGERQELNVGRLAMMGFASALIMEVVTGKGIFGQLGVDALTVRLPFLAGFSFLLVGGLLGGWVVINNPPDFSKVPANAGDGVPRNPFDKSSLDPQTTYTRGAVVENDEGKAVVLPIASDLKPMDK